MWSFPANFAKSESFATLLWGWWLVFMHTNQAHTQDPSILWATAKAVLRGRNIAYMASYKKKVAASYDKASSLFQDVYTKFKKIAHGSPQDQKILSFGWKRKNKYIGQL